MEEKLTKAHEHNEKVAQTTVLNEEQSKNFNSVEIMKKELAEFMINKMKAKLAAQSLE